LAHNKRTKESAKVGKVRLRLAAVLLVLAVLRLQARVDLEAWRVSPRLALLH
jgi:hypothetical protein